MKIEDAIKQSNFKNKLQKATVNIIYTGNWLRDLHLNTFKSFDLLPQHYNILRIIKGRHPEAVSPGQIKEVMLDKGNDVTRLIDKLVKKHLVKRKTCPENRRKIDITLTEKGMEVLEEMTREMDKINRRFFRQISEEEAALLSDLLDKFRG